MRGPFPSIVEQLEDTKQMSTNFSTKNQFLLIKLSGKQLLQSFSLYSIGHVSTSSDHYRQTEWSSCQSNEGLEATAECLENVH